MRVCGSTAKSIGLMASIKACTHGPSPPSLYQNDLAYLNLSTSQPLATRPLDLSTLDLSTPTSRPQRVHDATSIEQELSCEKRRACWRKGRCAPSFRERIGFVVKILVAFHVSDKLTSLVSRTEHYSARTVKLDILLHQTTRKMGPPPPPGEEKVGTSAEK